MRGEARRGGTWVCGSWVRGFVRVLTSDPLPCLGNDDLCEKGADGRIFFIVYLSDEGGTLPRFVLVLAGSRLG
jgi:hypothetical protein